MEPPSIPKDLSESDQKEHLLKYSQKLFKEYIDQKKKLKTLGEEFTITACENAILKKTNENLEEKYHEIHEKLRANRNAVYGSNFENLENFLDMAKRHGLKLKEFSERQEKINTMTTELTEVYQEFINKYQEESWKSMSLRRHPEFKADFKNLAEKHRSVSSELVKFGNYVAIYNQDNQNYIDGNYNEWLICFKLQKDTLNLLIAETNNCIINSQEFGEGIIKSERLIKKIGDKINEIYQIA